jgi:hypothetical protein
MRKTDDLPVHFLKATALAINRDNADVVEFFDKHQSWHHSRFVWLRSLAAFPIALPIWRSTVLATVDDIFVRCRDRLREH